jgi:hypothetical protein
METAANVKKRKEPAPARSPIPAVLDPYLPFVWPATESVPKSRRLLKATLPCQRFRPPKRPRRWRARLPRLPSQPREREKKLEKLENDAHKRAPLRDEREDAKRWTQQRAKSRELSKVWDRELKEMGLRLKGSEVRGWRRVAALRRVLDVRDEFSTA